MKKEKLIPRTYRIKPSIDKRIKKLKVKCGCSEARVIEKGVLNLPM